MKTLTTILRAYILVQCLPIRNAKKHPATGWLDASKLLYPPNKHIHIKEFLMMVNSFNIAIWFNSSIILLHLIFINEILKKLTVNYGNLVT